MLNPKKSKTVSSIAKLVNTEKDTLETDADIANGLNTFFAVSVANW